MIAPSEQPGGIDSSNIFVVGGIADGSLAIMFPPRPRQIITKAQAINLAAWLSVIADPDGKEFERVVEAIKRT